MAYVRGRCAGRSFNPRTKDQGNGEGSVARSSCRPCKHSVCKRGWGAMDGCTGQFEERQLGLTWTAKSHWSVSVSYGVKLLSISKCFVGLHAWAKPPVCARGVPPTWHRTAITKTRTRRYFTVQYSTY
ncbi:hypothetical protein VFPBJ_04437 [Purpureocillium lilacinum]|uniref:Uncharacterized protein n=1 Tax=Purpureocillium lilacinum TaxID=33203 RepID=A0A179GX28_PURLI|nr:hypothetical protein VFPBJ_04437 [Purpureocillium lilacinum]